MVALRPEDRRRFIVIAENSCFSGLFVGPDNRLALVDPDLSPAEMRPDCACGTHTLNGQPFDGTFDPVGVLEVLTRECGVAESEARAALERDARESAGESRTQQLIAPDRVGFALRSSSDHPRFPIHDAVAADRLQSDPEEVPHSVRASRDPFNNTQERNETKA